MPRKPISFDLDFVFKDIFPRFTVKQFDDVTFNIKPKLQGSDYDITGMTGKIFVGVNNDMFMQTQGITVTSNNINIVLDKNMLQKNGRAYAEIELTDSSGTITSSSFIFNIDTKIGEGGQIPGEFEGFVQKYERLISEFRSQVNSSIDSCNDNVDNKLNSVDALVNTKISDFENRFNALTASQQQDAEVIDARGGENSLKARLDKINSQLEHKANKFEVGSPLVATSVEEMIDTTRVYVNTTDGKWYSYNGNAWIIGGIYNSQGISDKSISPIKTTFLHVSPNLFNKDNITDNKGVYPYKDSLFGTLYDTNDAVTSDWIEVKPNTQYIKNFKGCLVTYDENKIPQDGWDNDGADVGFTFRTSPNIKYVRVSIMKIHSLSACQFQEGNVITDIKPYGEIVLDESIKVKVQNQGGKTDIYNKYNSLRWLAFGDSHTEQQSYQKWVNDKLNFTYISNSGLGGSCIAKGYGSVLSFIDRYKNNVTNTEIVTIYGGSNDYAQNVPLDNETNKLDNTTFKGAIREIIEWYSTNYPSKFLFFIAPTQCFYPQFASNGYKNNLGLLPLDYSNAVVEVCKEYSIEVIKLHESIGINIKNQSTLLEDGIHLTDETNKRVAQLIINSFEKIYY